MSSHQSQTTTHSTTLAKRQQEQELSQSQSQSQSQSKSQPHQQDVLQRDDNDYVIEEQEQSAKASASAGINLNIFGAIAGAFSSKSSNNNNIKSETQPDHHVDEIERSEQREESAKMKGAGAANANGAVAGQAEQFAKHGKVGYNPSRPSEAFRRSLSTKPAPSPPPTAVKDDDLPFLLELRGQRPLLARLRSKAREPATLLTLLAIALILLVQLSLPRDFFLFRPRDPPQPPPTCPSPNAFVQELYCRAPPHVPGTLYGKSSSSMALAAAAERVAAEFEYSKEDVNKGVHEFIRQMDEGLAKSGATMSQIPTYVTAVPNGTEKGLYMAVDLGGTNFRVCSIQLHGNSTFSLTQSKVKIPSELMVAKTSHELFGFLAKQIELFLQTHHEEHYTSHKEKKGTSEQDVFSLGFTFSFPVQQFGINKGTLIRWTKGFDIHDTIGKDVCALLQAEIDALGLPVRVAALVNDTVGTLMARSYTSPGKTGTLLGAIFGTGTNGAYVEKLDKVTKLSNMSAKEAGEIDKSTGEMIINTEWGSFDNELSVLPQTPYDADLDLESVNPGIQMFEKRVSGMFLGEILRRALLSLLRDFDVPLFADEHSNQNDIHSTTNVAPDSPLYKQWGLDSSFLSITTGDSSNGLKVTRQTLDQDYGVSAASAEDAEAVRLIASAIGKRAARLSAVAIAAIIISTGRLQNPTDIGTTNNATLEVNENDIVDIGVDGSLVEFYPRFEEYIREALREVPEIGPQGERKVRIGIAKDGSGVGAALIALVADQASKGNYPSSSSSSVQSSSDGSSFFSRLLDSINRNVRYRV
ncbi:Hexokinase_1-domain-containing protein [Sphaerulina musiva SO2202]|uniref:glucokinase n=1 Tax=Sphaerulina musiva (strain SO2202) TaxID=692275 RepID=N1QH31_SPHMS|nr:Hexokinase_1-domain-containing protein [Sphaerulina musiva SO2202]EMF16490.1 Hexokinase_1-domain-containing protein [Sphaerulina musiva SO2202]